MHNSVPGHGSLAMSLEEGTAHGCQGMQPITMVIRVNVDVTHGQVASLGPSLTEVCGASLPLRPRMLAAF